MANISRFAFTIASILLISSQNTAGAQAYDRRVDSSALPVTALIIDCKKADAGDIEGAPMLKVMDRGAAKNMLGQLATAAEAGKKVGFGMFLQTPYGNYVYVTSPKARNDGAKILEKINKRELVIGPVLDVKLKQAEDDKMIARIKEDMHLYCEGVAPPPPPENYNPENDAPAPENILKTAPQQSERREEPPAP